MVELLVRKDSNNDKIKEKIGFESLQQQLLVPNAFKSLTQDNHFYQITDFGKLFISACVK